MKDDMLTRRPAELSSIGSAGLAAILIGVLNEIWGITMGPYTQALLILVVGLISPAVTGLVARYRDQK
jgi:hypothetical protein